MKKYLFALIVLAAAFRTAHSQCTADAGPEKILTCAEPQATLEGSSNVPIATYAWSGPGGFSSFLKNPTITEAGEYSLTITDPGTNCTATALTSVFMDFMPPVVSLVGGTLNCANPSVTVSATFSPTFCTLFWTGPNGFVGTLPTLFIMDPGQYIVTVTNPSSGCTAVASIDIVEDITTPDVSATGGAIGCSNPTIALSGSSTTPGVTFQWSGPNNFISNEQNPTVTVPGDYTLTVVAPNGCMNSSVATVTTDGSIPVVMLDVMPVNCFGGLDGSISSTVNGGQPQYIFSWSNGETGSNLQNVPPGTYTVTVSDDLGCTGIATGIVTEPPQITINPILVTITSVTCFGESNGAIALPNPTGGIPPFTYAWSNGSNAKDISGLLAGIYTVTITDVNFCTATQQFIITEPVPLVVSTPVPCGSTVYGSVSGGTAPYAYVWRKDSPSGAVIATGPDPLDLIPGTYFLIVTDANGCIASTQFTIGPSNAPCTRITGQITYDENTNCQFDAGETPLGSWHLKAEGPNGTFYGLSNSDGKYVITVEPGNYTVSLIPQGYQPLICTNDIPVSLPQIGDSTQVDFLVQIPIVDCPAMSVDLGTPLLRRCFNNNYYYVQYCNNSPFEASDAYITLELDPFLNILGAQLPYTDLGNNTYRFELGTVPANFCDNFWVRVQVSCSAVLGQTHCSEAHIYPDTTCGPNAQWSGAHLEVNSQCDGDSLRFILKNTGFGDMTNPLEYIVIEDGIMSLQGSAAALASGATMTVSVPANGATWRLEAEQEPFSPLPNEPLLSVEGCTNSGSFSTGFVNLFPLGDAAPWVDVDCTPNIGSYDPNDKQGFPIGYGQERYIRPGTDLEYLIRFQNTGTDTAFTVVIRDTLSAWLDPLTIRPGASSHDYRFELAGEGTLIFDFQNILLPDSTANEPESHGFVQFQISPRADVPLETDILNTAAIYFDFNDPVITNTTKHRIGENFVTVGFWQPALPMYAVQVAPHPMQHASWISINPTVNLTGKFHLHVFNLMGKAAYQATASEAQFLLRKSDLPAGVYFFKIENEGVLLGSGKLIVE